MQDFCVYLQYLWFYMCINTLCLHDTYSTACSTISGFYIHSISLPQRSLIWGRKGWSKINQLWISVLINCHFLKDTALGCALKTPVFYGYISILLGVFFFILQYFSWINAHYSPRVRINLDTNSWPHYQWQAWFPSHEMGVKFNHKMTLLHQLLT